MVIISKTKLKEFGEQHADSLEAINDWWRKTKDANWSSLADIKKPSTRWIMLVMTDMYSISKEIVIDSLP